MVLPKIIVFCGVDGSGKTTISSLIKKELEKKGYNVLTSHSGALLKNPSDPKNSMSPFIAFFVFLKDYTQILLQYIHCVGCYDYLIFDRFLYDTLVKITYKQKFQQIQPLYIFLTKVLFPLPALSFLLVASPSILWNRDKEHSRKYHESKFTLYNKLPQFFPLIIISTEKSVATVTQEVKGHMYKKKL